jgi:hypothetical protein
MIMPNFDRTGPQGAGPMTGRSRGLCGRGRGATAFGQGKGWRRRGGWSFGCGRDVHGGGEDVPIAIPVAVDGDEADPEERRAVLKAERNRLKVRLREVEGTLTEIGRTLRGDGNS